jgi:hypothetical protein
LHFGLKKYTRSLDPLTELNGPGLRMATRELPAYKDAVGDWQAQLGDIENVPKLVAGADEPLVEQVDEIMD